MMARSIRRMKEVTSQVSFFFTDCISTRDLGTFLEEAYWEEWGAAAGSC